MFHLESGNYVRLNLSCSTLKAATMLWIVVSLLLANPVAVINWAGLLSDGADGIVTIGVAIYTLTGPLVVSLSAVFLLLCGAFGTIIFVLAALAELGHGLHVLLVQCVDCAVDCASWVVYGQWLRAVQGLFFLNYYAFLTIYECGTAIANGVPSVARG